MIFMFGGNGDGGDQGELGSSSRIKSSIWILWRQAYCTRNPETGKRLRRNKGGRANLSRISLTLLPVWFAPPTVKLVRDHNSAQAAVAALWRALV
jgi:hypothetical protein